MADKKDSFTSYETSNHCHFEKKSMSLSNICNSSISKTDRGKKRSIFQPFLGFFYTFLTSLFITLSSVFVKQLTYISPGQLSLIRNAGVFVGVIPIAVYSTKDILGPKNERLFLVGRGLLTATALYLNLIAYRYLPLAEAAVIMSTLPAIVTIFARIYLKESCGLVQSTCILVTICGVLLSIRLSELLSKRKDTSTDMSYYGGLASAVVCLLFTSATLVLLRKVKNVHFSVILMYVGLIGSIENGLINFLVAYYEIPFCGKDVVLVFSIGLLGFIGHCTFTLAIQKEEVGIVSVMRSSMDIVMAMVFQIIFFNKRPDIYNVSGACLVILSISVIGIRKWLLTLPEDSDILKKFKYLLF